MKNRIRDWDAQTRGVKTFRYVFRIPNQKQLRCKNEKRGGRVVLFATFLLKSYEFSGHTIVPNLMEKFRSVQLCSAVLALSGTWHGTSRAKLHAELGWESQTSHKCSRCLSCKFRNNLVPEYIMDPIIIKMAVSTRARTEKFQRSFYPYCISEWNELDPEIRTEPYFAAFKTELPSKNYPLQIYVFRIHSQQVYVILHTLGYQSW